MRLSFYRLAHGGERKIIEHDDIAAGGQGGGDFLQIFGFDLHG